jgi:hypothetical protein
MRPRERQAAPPIAALVRSSPFDRRRGVAGDGSKGKRVTVVNRLQTTVPFSPPRLEGQERVAGADEVQARRVAAGAAAVDSYWRTADGEGPLTNLVHDMRRIAADRQLRDAAERVAARGE